MSSAVMTRAAAPLANAAELFRFIKKFGGIDPVRVRLDPLPGTATEADLIRVNGVKVGALCELVEGTLVEKVMAYEESFIAVFIGTVLNMWVLPRGLGVVPGSNGMHRLAPGLVRLPDVSFVGAAKFQDRLQTRPAVAVYAPDIAVSLADVYATPPRLA